MITEYLRPTWQCPQCHGPNDGPGHFAGTCCKACARDGHAYATGRLGHAAYIARLAKRAAQWEQEAGQ